MIHVIIVEKKLLAKEHSREDNKEGMKRRAKRNRIEIFKLLLCYHRLTVSTKIQTSLVSGIGNRDTVSLDFCQI